MRYRNPINPGFYPDPSICRVGRDFYLVNSSFEYFPGVPIFHSTDLANWKQIGHCLSRRSQLELKGAKPSDGIYAPTIRHHNGRFYMVTTVRVPGGPDGNFYVHADDPAGEWSDPVWVAQGGIDPSLWFDDDGKVYFTSNGTGWAPVRGAYQAEIDIATGALLTETKFLWPGTGGQYPEAPHLLKRGEYYYLMLAEGGTEEGHMVTIARSRSPWGPFESCPHNPLLTHRSLMSPVQGTGHADFVEDADGNWWAVFLAFRYSSHGYHNLGRETFLAPMHWTADGWPVINYGKPIELEMGAGALITTPPASERDDFDKETPGLDWVFLRNPRDEDWTLSERPGWLGLRCSPVSLNDLHSPAFLGRRQRHFECRVTALVDFTPAAPHEEAGLAAIIANDHHYRVVLALRQGQRVASVRLRIGPMEAEIAYAPAPDGPVELSITADRTNYRFQVGAPGAAAREIAAADVRYLSTEVAGGYTGVILGMYAGANAGASENMAWFDWFDYLPLES